ncbi:Secreted protein [Pseudomonas sp. IT-P12]
MVADMVYLLADVGAAHTSPLLLPPLGHVDSIESVALQAIENLLRLRKTSSLSRACTLA